MARNPSPPEDAAAGEPDPTGKAAADKSATGSRAPSACHRRGHRHRLGRLVAALLYANARASDKSS